MDVTGDAKEAPCRTVWIVRAKQVREMRTRIKETNQYTCKNCGSKFTVGDVILTGTLSREAILRRGGRREGVCHCGTQFKERFACTKNVMYDYEGTPYSKRLALPRVGINTAGSRESPHFREIRELMATDEAFADSVRRTASTALETMLESSLDSVLGLAASMMTESHCRRMLAVPQASSEKWHEAVVSRLRGLSRTPQRIAGRRVPVSRMTQIHTDARRSKAMVES